MVGRQVDYWATVYRRTWRGSVVSSFVTPLLYVVAMGVLLGGYVDRGGADGSTARRPTSRSSRPGLLAAHAMQTAVGEVTYPVMGAIKWHKTYFAHARHPALGRRHRLGAPRRSCCSGSPRTSAVFLLVLSPFGVFASAPGALVALLATVLIGIAFATPIYALQREPHGRGRRSRWSSGCW